MSFVADKDLTKTMYKGGMIKCVETLFLIYKTSRSRHIMLLYVEILMIVEVGNKVLVVAISSIDHCQLALLQGSLGHVCC